MQINKENILKSIESFIGADNELAIKEAEHQIKVFEVVFQKEIENFQEKAEEDEKNLNPENEQENILILKAIQAFKKEQGDKKNKKKEEEKSNIKLKKEILENFQILINSKEELGHLARGIKEIRTNWNKIGSISPNEDHKLQQKFSKLNESFNYNFNIYKELKENDLKRNFSLKNQIIHELKNLSELKDYNKLQIELKILQNKWEEVGPTFKEHWEDLKKKYWSEVHIIQKRINEFYSNLKTNLKDNLENKKKLIEKVKELSSQQTNNSKEWDLLANQLKKCQEEWKKIGPVPKKENDKIWKEFRSYFDVFFDKRNKFLKIEKDNNKENYDFKLELIETAKKYVENIKNDSNPLLIKKLQEKWREIGNAGRFAEQKLWKKFRAQCDLFFETKKQNRNSIISAEKENLKTKNSLIIEFKKSGKSSFLDLMNFIDEFQKTGEVPRKKSEEIIKGFENLINQIINNNNFTKEEKHKITRAIKSSLLSNSSNPETTFINEKNRINKLINTTLKETTQLENNLGFFSNAKGKMLEDFQSKIEKNKVKISDWRDELKKLSEVYHKN
ncbi:MAG: DUF349 domain-containing protein [Flavobacteriales bacterium]|nr:DUF349 domain-containing protein [Flavobacteriales bacterium]MBL6869238.1 DUF349 domain-containing protein [Flavobacteriales bacterium]